MLRLLAEHILASWNHDVVVRVIGFRTGINMTYKGLSFGCRVAIAVIAACFVLHDAAAQITSYIEWQRSYGGTNNEFFSEMKPTSDGGYLLVGTSSSGPSGNKTSPLRGTSDLFVVKIGPDGQRQWDRSIGHGEVGLGGLVTTGDGGFALGATAPVGKAQTKSDPGYGEGDYWLLKFDAHGRKQWDRAYGGTGDDGLMSVSRTSDGGYLLGGTSRSGVSGNRTLPNRPGYPPGHMPTIGDHWIVKTDALGRKQWEKAHQWAYGFFIAAYPTPDGGYIFGDYESWFVKVNAAGKTEWRRSFAPTTNCLMHVFRPTPDGGFIAAGHHIAAGGGPNSTEMPDLRFVLVKVNGNWETEWSAIWGGSLSSVARDVQLTSDGGYLVGGNSQHSSTPGGQRVSHSRLFKFNANGDQQWDQTVAVDHGLATSVRETKDGGYLVGHQSISAPGGNKTAPHFGNFDFWLVKLKLLHYIP